MKKKIIAHQAIIKGLILILLILGLNSQLYSQNVVVTDDDSHIADPSSMLDIHSLTKGLLIPRLTTAQREAIVSPAIGLLVYDSNLSVFYYFNGSDWINISKGQVWDVNSNYVYLTSETNKVGIGTNNPNSKLEVKADASFTADDTLFSVKDKNGNTVFAVFPDGVKVIVEEGAKGKLGGFAISGRSPTKAGVETDIFLVTPDSTRVFVNDTLSAKGKLGGFAISGRSPTKGITNEYLVVTADSTRVYVNDSATVKGKLGGFTVSGRSPTKGTLNDYLQVTRDSTRVYVTESTTKGKLGGFAISGRSPTKGVTRKFMDMTKENYFIGHESGQKNTDGLYNSFMGYESGYSNTLGSNNSFIGYRTGYNNSSGNSNTFLGDSSGFGNTAGSGNLFVGKNSGIANENGNNNSFIGTWSGISNTTGISNSFMGSFSGYSNKTGSYNTFVGDSSGYYNDNGDFNVYIGDKAALFSNGSKNVAIGYRAGYNMVEADTCVFIGNMSGYNNTIGHNNTFIGDHSGYSNTEGFQNIFIGTNSGISNTDGDYNLYIGYNAGYKNAIGRQNVFIGNSSGFYNESGYQNTFIGFQSGMYETGSNKLYIDNSSTVNPLIYGDFATDKLKFNANVGIGVAPSYNCGLYVDNSYYTYAVYAKSNGGYAIYGDAGTSTSNYAGYFYGNVHITGSLSKGSGSFKIDHPLDPENKFLYHAFVESPDMKNMYDGNVILDNSGKAIVTLPDYFESLNMEFRYQLTAIGAPGPNLYIAEEISKNSFKIAGGTPGMKVSWQVTGIRQDKFAKKNPIIVEVEKADNEKGFYLHPEAFDLPSEKGIDYNMNSRIQESNIENKK